MPTTESIKTLARALGADLVGIADPANFTGCPAPTHPAAVLPSCKSVISIGCAFAPEILTADPDTYTDLRNKTSAKVTEIAKTLAARLAEDGHESLPVEALAVTGMHDGRHSGPISLKHAAALAGLGYIGKNTLLITPELGNMVWLSAVLTAAPFEADAPAAGECPEGCDECVAACPVSALGDPAMKQMTCLPHAFKFDADRKLTIECWKCREVCPNVFGNRNR